MLFRSAARARARSACLARRRGSFGATRRQIRRSIGHHTRTLEAVAISRRSFVSCWQTLDQIIANQKLKTN